MAQPSFFGVPVRFRPTALVSGIVVTLVAAGIARDKQPLLAVRAGLLWYLADGVHVAGHIVSSQMVGAPLDGIDAGLYPKNVYHTNNVSPQQHIGRSIGGVGASLLAAVCLAFFARRARAGTVKQVLTIAALQNGFLFVVSMLPIPMVDGGVIVANLRKQYAR